MAVAEDSSGVSFVLTPIQLYAMLNGKSISQGEIASNTWHLMPRPSDLQRLLAPFPEPVPPKRGAWGSGTECWRPPHEPPVSAEQPRLWATGIALAGRLSGGVAGIVMPQRAPLSSEEAYREAGSVELVNGVLESVSGVVLFFAPEPTLLSKPAGVLMAAHGADVTQAALRQLFSGRPVNDYTRQGATWAAGEMGASPRWARRLGYVFDVGVPFGIGAAEQVTAKVVSIRAGRIVLSEEAVYGKAGRISLAEEEEEKRTRQGARQKTERAHAQETCGTDTGAASRPISCLSTSSSGIEQLLQSGDCGRCNLAGSQSEKRRHHAVGKQSGGERHAGVCL